VWQICHQRLAAHLGVFILLLVFRRADPEVLVDSVDHPTPFRESELGAEFDFPHSAVEHAMLDSPAVDASVGSSKACTFQVRSQALVKALGSKESLADRVPLRKAPRPSCEITRYRVGSSSPSAMLAPMIVAAPA
jgi:hypothetical protein